MIKLTLGASSPARGLCPCSVSQPMQRRSGRFCACLARAKHVDCGTPFIYGGVDVVGDRAPDSKLKTPGSWLP